MKKWLADKGLVAEHVEALPMSMLYEELGISTYLKEDVCKIHTNTSWNKGKSESLFKTNVDQTVRTNNINSVFVTYS
jgi:uncharacterized protein involved in tellurium resistance